MKYINILAIETSCDDTSASVLRNNIVYSNIIANQDVHRDYGGVVPELASRAHQQHIIPVVKKALNTAKINKKQLNAIAFTRGPGLLGSLLVGMSFAKSMAMSLKIPIIDVDHLIAHIFALFLDEPNKINIKPKFPFIALIISGGHTKIAIVKDYLDIEYIGDTIDDAAGETFDKAAKILGLHYPGGPVIDKYAKHGNKAQFSFNKPNVPNYDYSFSGLKTSILYFIRDQLKLNPGFIKENLNDLCASIQKTITDVLIHKLDKAIKETKINRVGVVGGVSANSFLRKEMQKYSLENNVEVYFPDIKFTTDNAAMIGMVGYLKYQKKMFATCDIAPYST